MFGRMKDKFAGRHGCGERGDRRMEEFFAMRGGPFRGHPGRGGRGDGRGFGDDGEGRIGRFFAQGDLRLLVLALTETDPRHGYEIIKHLEDVTGGFYVPSPGVIYPTLTYLEEAGYIIAEADGNKKRYAITPEGRAHLDENRRLADAILERLAEFGEKVRQRQERRGGRDADTGPALPRSVDSALLNLREVIAKKLQADDAKAGDLVRLLLQVADDLDSKN
ncbi:PadR family transcriptional regulator [Pararhizobium sp.]|uniref:PadR family transcriptional regulator n=1 Tax=Pararhizobium sp. TaxID=1977563 RepID=UPI002720888E|nr:PadR family transcriptional regulator [Pararhizobium sp.]MDO9416957.1 PadR family transcriptional regulator [Pararhizobium sp.]